MTFGFQTRYILLDIPLFDIPHLILQPSQLHLLGTDLCLDLILGFPFRDLIGFKVGEFLFMLLYGRQVGGTKCALCCDGEQFAELYVCRV